MKDMEESTALLGAGRSWGRTPLAPPEPHEADEGEKYLALGSRWVHNNLQVTQTEERGLAHWTSSLQQAVRLLGSILHLEQKNSINASAVYPRWAVGKNLTILVLTLIGATFNPLLPFFALAVAA